MIRNIFLFMAFFGLAIGANAQSHDTMYIMKDGNVVAKYHVNNEIDSVIFYQPQGQSGNTFVDDRDGNVYRFVTIGDQTWMADNLRYLPFVTDSTEILDTPAYYVYGYGGTDVSAAQAHPNYAKYGVLYNWYAAMNGEEPSTSNPSGVRGICPTGWHLPSSAEWIELIDVIGDASIVGGKLKETGTEYWYAPNEGATNEYGFNARGGGLHARATGKFLDYKTIGYFWTTTPHEVLTNSIYTAFVWYDKASILQQNYDKPYGFSVRCVRD